MTQDLPFILWTALLSTILMFALSVGMLLLARRATERAVQARQPPLPNKQGGLAREALRKVNAEASPCRLLLVHGTWGQRSPFLAKNSPFQQAMKNGLPGLCGDIEIFQWSGKVWQSQRNKAAEDLSECLSGLLAALADDEMLVVVAHSHGGTITAQAMRRLDGKLDPAQLARIRVISFGTPYILYTFHPVSALAVFIWSWLLALGGLGALAWYYAHDWLGAGLVQPLIVFAASLTVGGLATAWFIRRRVEAEKTLGCDSGYPAGSRLLCMAVPGDEAITGLFFSKGIDGFASWMVRRFDGLVGGLLGRSFEAARSTLVGTAGGVFAVLALLGLVTQQFPGLPLLKQVNAFVGEGNSYYTLLPAVLMPVAAVATAIFAYQCIRLLLSVPLRLLRGVVQLPISPDMWRQALLKQAWISSTPMGHCEYVLCPAVEARGLLHSQLNENAKVHERIIEWIKQP